MHVCYLRVCCSLSAIVRGCSHACVLCLKGFVDWLSRRGYVEIFWQGGTGRPSLSCGTIPITDNVFEKGQEKHLAYGMRVMTNGSVTVINSPHAMQRLAEQPRANW
jgi:hypothetical protein